MQRKKVTSLDPVLETITRHRLAWDAVNAEADKFDDSAEGNARFYALESEMERTERNLEVMLSRVRRGQIEVSPDAVLSAMDFRKSDIEWDQLAVIGLDDTQGISLVLAEACLKRLVAVARVSGSKRVA